MRNGIERGRLRTGLGLIEFERTKELLLEHLPKPPAIVYDIGGGYGEYAWWLASLGYEVYLFDLSETNVRMFGELKGEYPGGLLFAAAISRFATLLWATTVYRAEKCHHRPNRLLEEEAFMKMIERELCDGEHIRPENSEYTGIGRSHFHAPEELEEEISDSGFSNTVLHGVVGAAWLAPGLDVLWKDAKARAALMRTVRLLDTERDVTGPVHPSACHIPKRAGRTALILFIYASIPHKYCILFLHSVYE